MAEDYSTGTSAPVSGLIATLAVLLLFSVMVSAQTADSSGTPSSQSASLNCKPPEKAGNPAEAAPGGEPFKVWVDSTAKIYYRWGSPHYGKTACGHYMSETDARTAGARHEGWYADYIQKEVQKHWSTKGIDPETPKGATVVVGFAISRAGLISNLRTVESSGRPSLDASCIEAVQAVRSFDPLPAAYKNPSLTVAYNCTYQSPQHGESTNVK